MKWWTVAEVAEHFRVTKERVYLLCASGQVRTRRYGSGRGTILIHPEDVRRMYVERR